MNLTLSAGLAARAHDRTHAAARSERTRRPQMLGLSGTRRCETGGAEPAQVRSSALPSISCSIASTAALSGARSWVTIRQTRGSFTRG